MPEDSAVVVFVSIDFYRIKNKLKHSENKTQEMMNNADKVSCTSKILLQISLQKNKKEILMHINKRARNLARNAI